MVLGLSASISCRLSQLVLEVSCPGRLFMAAILQALQQVCCCLSTWGVGARHGSSQHGRPEEALFCRSLGGYLVMSLVSWRHHAYWHVA